MEVLLLILATWCNDLHLLLFCYFSAYLLQYFATSCNGPTPLKHLILFHGTIQQVFPTRRLIFPDIAESPSKLLHPCRSGFQKVVKRVLFGVSCQWKGTWSHCTLWATKVGQLWALENCSELQLARMTYYTGSREGSSVIEQKNDEYGVFQNLRVLTLIWIAVCLAYLALASYMWGISSYCASSMEVWKLQAVMWKLSEVSWDMLLAHISAPCYPLCWVKSMSHSCTKPQWPEKLPQQ